MSDLTEARVRELAREEIRAAAQPVDSKPVAGEWESDSPSGRRRYAKGRGMGPRVVAEALSDGEWNVYLTVRGSDGKRGDTADLVSAMAAADAWARDNAHLLDWTLPPAPVQPVAPRELTIDSRSGAVWSPGEPLHSAECWEGSHRTCPLTIRAPDRSLVACACSCHAQPEPREDGVSLIAAERARQVSVDGWTPEHDDEHQFGELAIAGAWYARLGTDAAIDDDGEGWRSVADWIKPTPDNRVRELVKAGALIAAEIDRLRRAAPATKGGA